MMFEWVVAGVACLYILSYAAIAGAILVLEDQHDPCDIKVEWFVWITAPALAVVLWYAIYKHGG